MDKWTNEHQDGLLRLGMQGSSLYPLVKGSFKTARCVPIVYLAIDDNGKCHVEHVVIRSLASMVQKAPSTAMNLVNTCLAMRSSPMTPVASYALNVTCQGMSSHGLVAVLDPNVNVKEEEGADWKEILEK